MVYSVVEGRYIIYAIIPKGKGKGKGNGNAKGIIISEFGVLRLQSQIMAMETTR